MAFTISEMGGMQGASTFLVTLRFICTRRQLMLSHAMRSLAASVIFSI